MAIRTPDTCTVLNMKWVSTAVTLLREISTIMKHHALSASSSHVARCWWYLLGMTVRLHGPRSIMGTWWPLIMATGIQPTSSVLTGTQSMFPVAMPTRTVLCCTLWKAFVDHSHVFLMSAVENWHALCAPSDGNGMATMADELRRLNNIIIIMVKSITHCTSYFLWRTSQPLTG